MTQMRTERITFLQKLGANKRLPLVTDAPETQVVARAEVPSAEEASALEPALQPAPEIAIEAAAPKAAPPPKKKGPTGRLQPGGPPIGRRYRFLYEKIGPMALLGHLDIVRELPRVLRRASAPMVYTQGFHPKPDMTFGPALSLGVPSLSEYVDLRLDAVYDEAQLADLLTRMNAGAPGGLAFRGAALLGDTDPGVAKLVTGARYALVWARSTLAGAAGGDVYTWLADRCTQALAAETLPQRRNIDGVGKIVDVRRYLRRAEPASDPVVADVRRAGLVGDLVIADVEVDITGSGSVKSSEVAAALLGDLPHRAVRIALLSGDVPTLLDLPRLRKPARTAAPTIEPSSSELAAPELAASDLAAPEIEAAASAAE